MFAYFVLCRIYVFANEWSCWLWPRPETPVVVMAQKSQWLYLSKYQLSYNSFRSLDVFWQLSKLQAHVSDIYNMRDESQSVQSVI